MYYPYKFNSLRDEAFVCNNIFTIQVIISLRLGSLFTFSIYQYSWVVTEIMFWNRSGNRYFVKNQPKLKRESADRMMVWRRGTPISQALTLAANRSEHSDSPNEEGSGEMFTNISVFESPPRHGWMKIVLERVRTYNDLKDQKKRKNEVRIKDSSWK